MRLALVTHKFGKGDGQGRVNFELARAVLAAGHTVYLIASEVADDLARHTNARAVRIPVAGWPTELLRNQVFAVRTAHWLRRHRAEIDLVHVNGFTAWTRADVNSAHFVHSAWLRSPQHTARVRKDLYGLYQWLYTWCGARFERWSYARAAAVVAVSEQVERELKAIGVDPGRIGVIANGVDPDEFRPAAVPRASLGLPDGRVLLFVGDIKTPRKNLDTLLRALAHVPNVTLAVVGATAGSPYPKLAAEIGVADRVRFLGYRRDVARLMQAADVFVFPSRYEACSLVLLEAAASGLPVVAARTAGGVELFTRDSAVLLEDPNDDRCLAMELNALLRDPAKLAAMSTASRSVAEANSWAAMAQRYLVLYDDLRSTTCAAVDGAPMKVS